MRLLLSLCIWPSPVRIGLSPKRLLRSQFLTNGTTKFPLLPLQVGVSFGTNKRPRRKQLSFGLSFIRRLW